MTDLAPGAVLAERYRVLQCLIADEVGAVYEVIDVERQRLHALMVMPAEMFPSDEMRARFEEQVRIVAQMESEHVPAMMATGVDEATRMPFLVMERLVGLDLGRRLEQTGPLPAPEVMTYLGQAATALDWAHEMGIVHLDLKPGRLFLTHLEDGSPRIKILGFGILALFARQMVGTPPYMAPERFHPRAHSTRAADLYALAMTTYTLLVGVPYWSVEMEAGDIIGLMFAVLAPVKEPATFRAAARGVELPPRFDAWFARATAVDPAERFSTASDMVIALGEVLTAKAPSVPGAPAAPTPPWWQREPEPEPVAAPPGSAPSPPPDSEPCHVPPPPASGAPPPPPPSDRQWVFGAVGALGVAAAAAARRALDVLGEKKTRRLTELSGAAQSDVGSAASPWARAYRPSWILPRRRSSLHVYVFLPHAAREVRDDALAALAAPSNVPRESHAVRLRRALGRGEPLIVRVTLPGFQVGEPEPEPWQPPYVRFIVTVDAPPGVAIGVHRPLVTVRSGRPSGELLATFDFDLTVLARAPKRARLLALGGGGVALALAAIAATQEHLLPPVVSVPLGAIGVLGGGAGAWAVVGSEKETPAPIQDRMTDVLIVTAVKEEYRAVLAVDDGAVARSRWEERPGATGVDVAFREFTTPRGVMRVAVVQALGMGAANALAVSAQLVQEYGVRCLAMCGVCAGRRGEVALGDVIVADRLWQYDTGKRETRVGATGQRVAVDQRDIDMYRIRPPRWSQDAERFEVEADAAWLHDRPRTYEAQGDWILERLLHGVDPATDPAQEVMCKDYQAVMRRLWKQGLLLDKKLSLTDRGRARIEDLLVVHRGKLPEPRPLRVHVGPIASGNEVIADTEIFSLLADDVRKVVGVEMEAAAIATLAHTRELPFSVVMKAVMDHADEDKSDNFKTFAARASAECLIAFLRKNLPPCG